MDQNTAIKQEDRVKRTDIASMLIFLKSGATYKLNTSFAFYDGSVKCVSVFHSAAS